MKAQVMDDYLKSKEELISEITELRGKLADEKKLSLEKLAVIIHDGPDGIIVINPKNEILFANPAAEKIIGRRQKFIAGTRLAIPRKQGKTFEMDLLSSDGKTIPVELRRQNTNWEGKPADIISIRDISERKKAREELQKNRELLDRTGKTAGVGGWEADLITGGFFWTDAMKTMFEVEKDFKPGLEAVMEFIAGDDRSKTKEALRNAVDNGTPFDVETALISAKGNRIWARFTGKPEFENEKCIRLYGTFQNITALKIAEKKRLEAENRLHQARKMEAIGALAGGIAHDFRNILQIVSGYNRLLMRGKDQNDRDYEKLKTIEKAVEKAVGLIDQLVLFSQKAESERKIISLNDEIERVKSSLVETLPKSIKITTQLNNDLPNIKADPFGMEQVLLNLAKNAADAMPDGGEITIKTQNIFVNDEILEDLPELSNGHYVELIFCDTGVGIDREIKEKMFDPFFTTKEIGSGTGLGLSTVYGIVKSHKGMILCSGETFTGACFKIYLPALVKVKKRNNHLNDMHKNIQNVFTEI